MNLMTNIFSRLLKRNHNVNFIDSIEEHDFIKLLEYDKNTKLIADSAMENFIIPFPNFAKTDFNNDHDWNVTNKRYGKSYQLYIHSLRFVGSLLLEYDKTKDIKYLEKSEFYIESWIDFMESKQKNEMLWYDHPVANRVQNIIYFLYLSKNTLNIDESKYYKLLKKHGEFLMDDKNYKYNNHSLMMDRSLMILGNILENRELYSTGFRRAKETFWYSFSSKGSHLENSPDYHRMVVKMYLDMEKYLNKHDQTFGDVINKRLSVAGEFLPVISRPDKRLPALGDSGNSALGRKKEFENFSDNELGLTVIQNEDFYTSFTAGYSTVTHKHRDDLSITLFYKGEDVLVDSGKFSYGGDIRRRYIMSPQAHSSLFFENDDYKLDNDNRFSRKVQTTKYFDNKKYTFVEGKNHSFESSKLSRRLIALKNYPVVILLDSAQSKEESNIYQNFNLSPQIEIVKYEASIATIKTKSGNIVTFTQLQDIKEKIDIIPSQTEPVQSIVTSGYGKAIETKQLRFSAAVNSNTDYVFKTIISMDDSLNIQVTDINESALEISVNGEEIFINI